MKDKLYTDKERKSLVYFHQEKGLWERVDLVLPVRSPRVKGVRGYKPSEIIKKNLGTTIGEIDFEGLEEWPQAIETTISEYSKSGFYVHQSRPPRKQRLEMARDEMIDWIAGANEVIRTKP